MTSEEKKAYLLLKSIIFHYHGLDESEQKNLKQTAEVLGAEKEFNWVNEFIAKDYFNSFERARNYLNDTIGNFPADKRIFYIEMVWQANRHKGYITELEATAMLKLAKDWKVEDQLLEIAKKISQSTDSSFL